MGVPSFFKWISDHYKSLIRSDLPNNQKRVLFLDLNGAIHPAVKSDLNMPRENMTTAVCQYLDNIVKTCNPHEIYIAIDGVAPRAKMEQQRERRYKSALESKYLQDLALRTGNEDLIRIEPVDFNMISPGTQFMAELHQKLREHIAGYIERHIPVTLSDANVPGEGEHKIMAEIRKRTCTTDQFIVYGLDADLIFLSMINRPSIFLLREASNFDNEKEKGHGMFKYFDINGLVEILSTVLNPTTLISELIKFGINNSVNGYESDQKPKKSFNKKRALIDYTYICFFLGNDFIPRLPCLRIRDDALADLIILYKEIRWSQDDYLINDDLTVNTVFLQKYIGEISKLEDQLLEQQTQNKYDRVTKFNYHNSKKGQYEREKNIYQYVEARCVDSLQMGTYGWRARYYKYHLTHELSKSQMNTMCNFYIEGTIWVLKYYIGHTNNWSWHYPYCIAPSALDLANWLQSYGKSNIQYAFSNDEPVSSLVQLMSILPPDSSDLLPPSLARLMTDKDSVIHHMYPVKFQIPLEGSVYLHECRPRLPYIDRDILSIAVASKLNCGLPRPHGGTIEN
jgi:5'-3' exonuclease